MHMQPSPASKERHRRNHSAVLSSRISADNWNRCSDGFAWEVKLLAICVPQRAAAVAEALPHLWWRPAGLLFAGILWPSYPWWLCDCRSRLLLLWRQQLSQRQKVGRCWAANGFECESSLQHIPRWSYEFPRERRVRWRQASWTSSSRSICCPVVIVCVSIRLAVAVPPKFAPPQVSHQLKSGRILWLLLWQSMRKGGRCPSLHISPALPIRLRFFIFVSACTCRTHGKWKNYWNTLAALCAGLALPLAWKKRNPFLQPLWTLHHHMAPLSTAPSQPCDWGKTWPSLHRSNRREASWLQEEQGIY